MEQILCFKKKKKVSAAKYCYKAFLQLGCHGLVAIWWNTLGTLISSLENAGPDLVFQMLVSNMIATLDEFASFLF